MADGKRALGSMKRRGSAAGGGRRAKLGPRADRAQPQALEGLGWRYHHVGIPTRTPRPGEKYLRDYGMYVSGFDTSPFGIEWMRFAPGCPLPRLVRTVPHVAFQVEDLEAALQGRRVLIPPDSPSKGVRCAMIVEDGAPVELLEFRPGRAEKRP